MAIVAPHVGEVLLLKYMLNHTAPTDVRMHLYTSNITPGESDVLSTYSTNEVTDVSYTAPLLTGSSWVVSTTSGVTKAVYAQQEFSFTNSAVVYGVYFTDDDSSNLLFADRFSDGPYNIASGGGVILVDPEIELD